MSSTAGARRGIVFVISAPSGTGKSTLARTLLESVPDLRFSVSYTTRPRRAGEESGREYHFVDEARFAAMVTAGGLLEWAKVFGNSYGTGREATETAIAAGQDLLLDIDVQGARQIRDSGLDAVSIFVLPPSYSALEANPTQAHIHVGQQHTNGGITLFLCTNAATPPAGVPVPQACPPGPAEIEGTLTQADVLAVAPQGIDANGFAEVLRAIRAGATYANVHSERFPGGEIRGAITRDD